MDSVNDSVLDSPYHPSRYPGAPVDPVSGLACGPTVWREQMYCDVHGVPENHKVLCHCGRTEWALMMMNVGVLPANHRPRPDAEWSCSQCVTHMWFRGTSSPLWYYTAHGAPHHIVDMHRALALDVAYSLAALEEEERLTGRKRAAPIAC